MKVTLISTEKVVTLRTDGGGAVPARVWEGETESGIPVHAFITRMAVENTADTTEFEKELEEHAAPSPEVEAIPLRMIL